MNFSQSFRLALKALSASKMRTILTMLGIIIGVAAVIIIISLGNGMQNMITAEFESMGTNLVQATIMGRDSSRSVTVDEMYKLVEEHPDCLESMTPNVTVAATVKAGTDTYAASITGVNEQYDEISVTELSEGRFIQYIDVERLQNVCVIGAYLNQEAYDGAGLGQSIRVDGAPYIVIGIEAVTDEAGGASAYNDNNVYIPYTNATRLNGNTNIGTYLFGAVEEQSIRAKAIIEQKLEKVYGSDDYYMVICMSEMLTMMDSIMGTVQTVLVAIAAISLLVGGIGIMNIMLVSVTERTREIGIRKSLGAKRRDIRSQFIIEAGTTSAIGGMIGILVGVGLASFAGKLVNITAAASPDAILTAFSVSVAVGVLFGYLPANKAAKLNPIDALRYE